MKEPVGRWPPPEVGYRARGTGRGFRPARRWGDGPERVAVTSSPRKRRRRLLRHGSRLRGTPPVVGAGERGPSLVQLGQAGWAAKDTVVKTGCS